MTRDKIKSAWRDGWQFVVNDTFFQTEHTTEADFRHLLLPGVLKVGEQETVRLRWVRRDTSNQEKEPQA